MDGGITMTDKHIIRHWWNKRAEPGERRDVYVWESRGHYDVQYRRDGRTAYHSGLDESRATTIVNSWLASSAAWTEVPD